MSTFGQRLRNERESKGASRVDVAQTTKVAVHHLAALEYGDFDALPGAVHTKGYVRVYAEYLGLDPTAALSEFLDEYEAARPGATGDSRDDVVRKMSKMLTGSERSPVSRYRPVLLVAAVMAVLVLGWFGLRRIDLGGAAPDATGTGTESAMTAAEAPPPLPDPAPESAAAAPTEPAATPLVEERAAAEEVEPPPAAEPHAVARDTEPPPVVATQAPSVAAPARTLPGALSIREFGVGTSVENRRLKGESNRFQVGTRVWFWTRVMNGRSGDEVRHVWRHEGNLIASIPLTLGSANWRTYSRKTMYPGSVGSWTVEAVDEVGNVLAGADFTCEP